MVKSNENRGAAISPFSFSNVDRSITDAKWQTLDSPMCMHSPLVLEIHQFSKKSVPTTLSPIQQCEYKHGKPKALEPQLTKTSILSYV